MSISRLLTPTLLKLRNDDIAWNIAGGLRKIKLRGIVVV